MMNAITHPDRFFGQIDRDGGIGVPAFIVMLAMVSQVPASALVVATLSGARHNAGILWLGLVIGGAASITTGLILWFVQAGVMYAISARFGGTGDFRVLLKFVGWTYVPLIFAGVVDAVATFEAIQAIGHGIDRMAPKMAADQLAHHHAVVIAGAARTLFILWQGALLVFVIKHARKLDLGPAIFTVSLPVGSTIGFRLWGLL